MMMNPKSNSNPKLGPRPAEVKSGRELKHIAMTNMKPQFIPIPAEDQVKIVNRLIDYLEAK